MASQRIDQLPALASPAAADLVPVLDVDDLTDPNGTVKKVPFSAFAGSSVPDADATTAGKVNLVDQVLGDGDKTFRGAVRLRELSAGPSDDDNVVSLSHAVSGTAHSLILSAILDAVESITGVSLGWDEDGTIALVLGSVNLGSEEPGHARYAVAEGEVIDYGGTATYGTAVFKGGLYISGDPTGPQGPQGPEGPAGTGGPWAFFNGEGTPALIEGDNVSSITDNGTGDYTVVWDVDFADADYGVLATAEDRSTGAGGDVEPFVKVAYGGRAAGSCRVQVRAYNGSAYDVATVTVSTLDA